ncbi:hypothetical protein ACJX0J_017471 [Zea mays]
MLQILLIDEYHVNVIRRSICLSFYLASTGLNSISILYIILKVPVTPWKRIALLHITFLLYKLVNQEKSFYRDYYMTFFQSYYPLYYDGDRPKIAIPTIKIHLFLHNHHLPYLFTHILIGGVGVYLLTHCASSKGMYNIFVIGYYRLHYPTILIHELAMDDLDLSLDMMEQL